MLEKFCEYNSPIPATVVESEAYQRELKKLQRHYGFRVVLNSYGQAEWDNEGAVLRMQPWQEFWLQVEAAKDIMGTAFARKNHLLLAAGKTSEEIIKTIGSFEKFQEDYLNGAGKRLFLSAICNRIRRGGKWWLKSYYGN
ncbi:MAG: hypothetical protein LBT55_00340 [Clostridiaceae bacterium]|jgi:hypothetical protein|nr:hypothetical protein [Clostridiaceae bacterium]